MPYDYEVKKQRLAGLDMQWVLIATALKARAGCKSSIPEILNLETLTSDMVGITDARDRTAIIDRLCELGFLRQVTGRDDPMHPYRTFTWIGP